MALLRSRGARIGDPREPAIVPPDVDEVVFTAAVNSAHVEVAEAGRRGIRCSKYAEFLGREMAGKHGIAIAGTHGKTTTVGLLGHVLLEAGRDPDVVIGGFPRGWPLPGRSGQGEYFVAEACEFDRSFLRLAARTALVTNVEADHLDYFGTDAAVAAAFQQFVNQVPADGQVFLHERAAARIDRRALTASSVVVGAGAGVEDRLVARGGVTWLEAASGASVALTVAQPGEHNVQNAALVASSALRLGIEPAQITAALATFPGVRRRLELLPTQDGRRWYSDYAHHPTEIRAVHESLRPATGENRLTVVFQPHQACRTRTFREEFARELARFDCVILPGIFSVREPPEEIERELRALADSMARHGRVAELVAGNGGVRASLMKLTRPGDTVILMGAGDIDDLAEELRGQPGTGEVTVA